MDDYELMCKFRELAKEHGWKLDWDSRGDQYGNGDQEYTIWLTPAGDNADAKS